MAVELGKVSHSGEEVLALKKYIQKCNVDNEKLKELIACNKGKDDFLFKYRCGATIKLHEVPFEQLLTSPHDYSVTRPDTLCV